MICCLILQNPALVLILVLVLVLVLVGDKNAF